MADAILAESGPAQSTLRFSLCTLVTKPEQYASFRQSFEAAGFSGDDCEYLTIDNSDGNRFDGYSGGNWFLSEARGEFIIICHQDVEAIDHRNVLEARLGELEALDANWAVAGNAGGYGLYRRALRISDPHGENRSIGSFPQRVSTLDENFLVIRRSANLGFSRDLSGFHFYGSDLCTLADIRGYSCYVLNFHLRHLSGGMVDRSVISDKESFYGRRAEFIRKYRRALRDRLLEVPCTRLIISSSWLKNQINKLNWLVALIFKVKK